MKISITKYAEALAEAIKDEKDSKKIAEKIGNLLKLLVKRRQAKQIRRFGEEFKNIWLKTKGQLEVKITLPYEQSDAEKENLAHSLEEILKKQVILNIAADENIIGGMKLEFEDYVIDATIVKNLEMLKSVLVTN